MSSVGDKRKQQLEELSFYLGRELSARTVMFHSAIAEKLGLSVTEHKALDLLSRHGPMPAGQLAELTGLTSGAVTGMVDRLEKTRFLRRKTDPNDRRKVIIEANEEKYEEMAGLFESLAQGMNRLLGSYNDEALTVIHDFLSKLPGLMQEETEKLKRQSLNTPGKLPVGSKQLD